MREHGLGPLTLHHCPESRSMKTLWLLEELGVEYELRTHSFGRALRAPEYLAIHPLGRVPCLETPDGPLFESGAIAEYLCELTGSALGARPATPERAPWLQWLHYSETMAAHLANLTQQFVALDDPALRSPVIVKLETRRLEKSMWVVDSILRGRDHLLGDAFSAVDIGIGYALYIGRLFTDLDAFPNLERYLARLATRPAFRAALPDDDDPNRFYLAERYRLDPVPLNRNRRADPAAP